MEAALPPELLYKIEAAVRRFIDLLVEWSLAFQTEPDPERRSLGSGY